MNKSILVVLAIVVVVLAVPLLLKSKPDSNAMASEQVQQSAAAAPAGTEAAGKALPRFVDLGTTTCAPCKVMLGVMAELEQKYPGAMIVEFVNVQEQPVETQRYGIRTIPTQIFFGPDGRELYRHIGVMRTEAVIAKWAELGIVIKPTSGS